MLGFLQFFEEFISELFSDPISSFKDGFKAFGDFIGWFAETISALIISYISGYFETFLLNSKSDFIRIGDSLIDTFFSFFHFGSADFFSYLVGLLFFLFLFRLLLYIVSNLLS